MPTKGVTHVRRTAAKAIDQVCSTDRQLHDSVDADVVVSLMLEDHRVLESDQWCIGGGGLLESG